MDNHNPPWNIHKTITMCSRIQISILIGLFITISYQLTTSSRNWENVKEIDVSATVYPFYVTEYKMSNMTNYMSCLCSVCIHLCLSCLVIASIRNFKSWMILPDIIVSVFTLESIVRTLYQVIIYQIHYKYFYWKVYLYVFGLPIYICSFYIAILTVFLFASIIAKCFCWIYLHRNGKENGIIDLLICVFSILIYFATCARNVKYVYV
jgi:hypothetical protein